MHLTRACLITLLFSAALAARAADNEFPWKDFERRTFAQLSMAHSDSPNGSAEIFPSKIRVTFTGQSRPMPLTHKGIVTDWAKNYAKNPDDYTGLYQNEYLFLEKNAQHWLPVENKIEPALAKELKKNDPAMIYVIRIGRKGASGPLDRLFLVEEFQAEKSAANPVKPAPATK
jgi:hypothetical protein